MRQQSKPSESKCAPRSRGNCYCRTVVFTAIQMFGHDSLSCWECQESYLVAPEDAEGLFLPLVFLAL